MFLGKTEKRLNFAAGQFKGRSIYEKLIPTVCNLKNMLEKVDKVRGDYSQFKQWKKRNYKAYNIKEIKPRLLNVQDNEKKEIVRRYILSGDPKDFGASCIDIYLVAYVSENYGNDIETFFDFAKTSGISDKENAIQAIWQVRKGDGVYLGILNENGTVFDWNFVAK